MNRRLFIKSGLILAAPAIFTSKGVFAGSVPVSVRPAFNPVPLMRSGATTKLIGQLNGIRRTQGDPEHKRKVMAEIKLDILQPISGKYA